MKYFFYVLLVVISSCAIKKEVNFSNLESKISNELSSFKKLKKYRNYIDVHKTQSYDSLQLYVVDSYFKKNKSIRFYALKYDSRVLMNLNKFEHVIIDSSSYIEFEESLQDLYELNNDSVNILLNRLKGGVVKSKKDSRKNYYKS